MDARFTLTLLAEPDMRPVATLSAVAVPAAGDVVETDTGGYLVKRVAHRFAGAGPHPTAPVVLVVSDLRDA